MEKCRQHFSVGGAKTVAPEETLAGGPPIAAASTSLEAMNVFAAPSSTSKPPIAAASKDTADALCPAVAFLYNIAALLPEFEAGAFKCFVDCLERGEPFEKAFGLPSDWRPRERNRRIRSLASKGISSKRLAELLRHPIGPFAEEALKILKLNNGRALSERQVRNILN